MSNLKSNLVIVGSRGRPENAQRCFEVLKKMSHISDFMLLINADQVDLYPAIDGVRTMVVAESYGTTSTAKANFFVDQRLFVGYKTVSGIDDDCIVTTPGWDILLTEPLREKGFGVSWGNDTIQNGRVPTKWTMTANIIEALGFIAPAGLIHLFVDDFLAQVGKALDSAHYLPHVMMEHHHWSNGKAPRDETYAENNTSEVWGHDERTYTDYMRTHFSDDIKRVKRSLNLA